MLYLGKQVTEIPMMRADTCSIFLQCTVTDNFCFLQPDADICSYTSRALKEAPATGLYYGNMEGTAVGCFIWGHVLSCTSAEYINFQQ